jgi:glycosyltransferase involved in cell wall biosynthesis
VAGTDRRGDPSPWARSFRAPAPSEQVQPGDAPTFSVIIAAYQAAEFIGEAVESALAQTTPAHEVIVCDDGSTDELERALAPYRDEITLIRKKRGGAASALNVAAAAASGDFVAVLDADDAYVPERLEALGSLAAARPDLDIVTTDASVERDGRVVGRFNAEVEFAVDDQRLAILDRCFCAWSAYRRDRLIAAGGYDEALSIAYDWESALRLIFGGAQAGLVAEPLYRYRLRPESLAANRLASLAERVDMLANVERRHRLSPVELKFLERSLVAQRRSLVLTNAEAALRAGDADARRRALAVTTARGVGIRTRIAGVASAAAPQLARRVLDRRARTPGGSRLERSYPGDEPRA